MNIDILLKTAFKEIPLHPVYTVENFKHSLVYTIADLLLNQSLIKAGYKKFQVLEIEPYFQQQGHNDPFVTGHDRNPVGKIQSTFGNWLDDNGGLEYSVGESNKFRSILISALKTNDKHGEIIRGKWNVRQALLDNSNNDLIKGIGFELCKSREELLLCGPRQINMTEKSSYRELPYRLMSQSGFNLSIPGAQDVLESSLRLGLISKEKLEELKTK